MGIRVLYMVYTHSHFYTFTMLTVTSTSTCPIHNRIKAVRVATKRNINIIYPRSRRSHAQASTAKMFINVQCRFACVKYETFMVY